MACSDSFDCRPCGEHLMFFGNNHKLTLYQHNVENTPPSILNGISLVESLGFNASESYCFGSQMGMNARFRARAMSFNKLVNCPGKFVPIIEKISEMIPFMSVENFRFTRDKCELFISYEARIVQDNVTTVEQTTSTHTHFILRNFVDISRPIYILHLCRATNGLRFFPTRGISESTDFKYLCIPSSRSLSVWRSFLTSHLKGVNHREVTAWLGKDCHMTLSRCIQVSRSLLDTPFNAVYWLARMICSFYREQQTERKIRVPPNPFKTNKIINSTKEKKLSSLAEFEKFFLESEINPLSTHILYAGSTPSTDYIQWLKFIGGPWYFQWTDLVDCPANEDPDWVQEMIGNIRKKYKNSDSGESEKEIERLRKRLYAPSIFESSCFSTNLRPTVVYWNNPTGSDFSQSLQKEFSNLASDIDLFSSVPNNLRPSSLPTQQLQQQPPPWQGKPDLVRRFVARFVSDNLCVTQIDDAMRLFNSCNFAFMPSQSFPTNKLPSKSHGSVPQSPLLGWNGLERTDVGCPLPSTVQSLFSAISHAEPISSSCLLHSAAIYPTQTTKTSTGKSEMNAKQFNSNSNDHANDISSADDITLKNWRQFIDDSDKKARNLDMTAADYVPNGSERFSRVEGDAPGTGLTLSALRSGCLSCTCIHYVPGVPEYLPNAQVVLSVVKILISQSKIGIDGESPTKLLEEIFSDSSLNTTADLTENKISAFATARDLYLSNLSKCHSGHFTGGFPALFLISKAEETCLSTCATLFQNETRSSPRLQSILRLIRTEQGALEEADRTFRILSVTMASMGFLEELEPVLAVGAVVCGSLNVAKGVIRDHMGLNIENACLLAQIPFNQPREGKFNNRNGDGKSEIRKRLETSGLETERIVEAARLVTRSEECMQEWYKPDYFGKSLYSILLANCADSILGGGFLSPYRTLLLDIVPNTSPFGLRSFGWRSREFAEWKTKIEHMLEKKKIKVDNIVLDPNSIQNEHARHHTQIMNKVNLSFASMAGLRQKEIKAHSIGLLSRIPANLSSSATNKYLPIFHSDHQKIFEMHFDQFHSVATFTTLGPFVKRVYHRSPLAAFCIGSLLSDELVTKLVGVPLPSVANIFIGRTYDISVVLYLYYALKGRAQIGVRLEPISAKILTSTVHHSNRNSEKFNNSLSIYNKKFPNGNNQLVQKSEDHKETRNINHGSSSAKLRRISLDCNWGSPTGRIGNLRSPFNELKKISTIASPHSAETIQKIVSFAKPENSENEDLFPINSPSKVEGEDISLELPKHAMVRKMDLNEPFTILSKQAKNHSEYLLDKQRSILDLFNGSTDEWQAPEIIMSLPLQIVEELDLKFAKKLMKLVDIEPTIAINISAWASNLKIQSEVEYIATTACTPQECIGLKTYLRRKGEFFNKFCALSSETNKSNSSPIKHSHLASNVEISPDTKEDSANPKHIMNPTTVVVKAPLQKASIFDRVRRDRRKNEHHLSSLSYHSPSVSVIKSPLKPRIGKLYVDETTLGNFPTHAQNSNGVVAFKSLSKECGRLGSENWYFLPFETQTNAEDATSTMPLTVIEEFEKRVAKLEILRFIRDGNQYSLANIPADSTANKISEGINKFIEPLIPWETLIGSEKEQETKKGHTPLEGIVRYNVQSLCGKLDIRLKKGLQRLLKSTIRTLRHYENTHKSSTKTHSSPTKSHSTFRDERPPPPLQVRKRWTCRASEPLSAHSRAVSHHFSILGQLPQVSFGECVPYNVAKATGKHRRVIDFIKAREEELINTDSNLIQKLALMRLISPIFETANRFKNWPARDSLEAILVSSIADQVADGMQKISIEPDQVIRVIANRPQTAPPVVCPESTDRSVTLTIKRSTSPLHAVSNDGFASKLPNTPSKNGKNKTGKLPQSPSNNTAEEKPSTMFLASNTTFALDVRAARRLPILVLGSTLIKPKFTLPSLTCQGGPPLPLPPHTPRMFSPLMYSPGNIPDFVQKTCVVVRTPRRVRIPNPISIAPPPYSAAKTFARQPSGPLSRRREMASDVALSHHLRTRAKNHRENLMDKLMDIAWNRAEKYLESDSAVEHENSEAQFTLEDSNKLNNEMKRNFKKLNHPSEYLDINELNSSSSYVQHFDANLNSISASSIGEDGDDHNASPIFSSMFSSRLIEFEDLKNAGLHQKSSEHIKFDSENVLLLSDNDGIATFPDLNDEVASNHINYASDEHKIDLSLKNSKVSNENFLMRDAATTEDDLLMHLALLDDPQSRKIIFSSKRHSNRDNQLNETIVSSSSVAFSDCTSDENSRDHRNASIAVRTVELFGAEKPSNLLSFPLDLGQDESTKNAFSIMLASGAVHLRPDPLANPLDDFWALISSRTSLNDTSTHRLNLGHAFGSMGDAFSNSAAKTFPTKSNGEYYSKRIKDAVCSRFVGQVHYQDSLSQCPSPQTRRQLAELEDGFGVNDCSLSDEGLSVQERIKSDIQCTNPSRPYSVKLTGGNSDKKDSIELNDQSRSANKGFGGNKKKSPVLSDSRVLHCSSSPSSSSSSNDSDDSQTFDDSSSDSDDLGLVQKTQAKDFGGSAAGSGLGIAEISVRSFRSPGSAFDRGKYLSQHDPRVVFGPHHISNDNSSMISSNVMNIDAHNVKESQMHKPRIVMKPEKFMCCDRKQLLLVDGLFPANLGGKHRFVYEIAANQDAVIDVLRDKRVRHTVLEFIVIPRNGCNKSIIFDI